MRVVRTRLLAAAILAAAVLSAGCNKDSSTKNAGTEPPPGPTGGPPGAEAKLFDAESGPHAAGKKVLVSSGCFRCHAVDGAKPAGGPGGPGGIGALPKFVPGGPKGGPPPEGGPGGPPKGGPPPGGPGGPGGPGRGGMGGPDLGHVAGDPSHTAEWLANYIRDPKSVKSDSKMPAFEGKLSEDDLKALVEYLASLK